MNAAVALLPVHVTLSGPAIRSATGAANLALRVCASTRIINTHTRVSIMRTTWCVCAPTWPTSSTGLARLHDRVAFARLSDSSVGYVTPLRTPTHVPNPAVRESRVRLPRCNCPTGYYVSRACLSKVGLPRAFALCDAILTRWHRETPHCPFPYAIPHLAIKAIADKHVHCCS